MGKRKRSGDDDYSNILRKVKKLEAKLRKRRHRSSSLSSESEYEYEHRRYYEMDTQDDEIIDVDEEVHTQSQPTHLEEYYQDAPFHAPALPPTPLAECVPPATAPAALHTPPAAAAPEPRAMPTATRSALPPVNTTPGAPSAFNVPPAAGTSKQNADEAQAAPQLDENLPSLDPDILQLLGEDPATEQKYGTDLHKDIVSRWAHILTNGLPKEAQLELIKKYLPPKNCPNVAAPKLNLEIKAALSEINTKKDLYSQSKQNQLSTSLAALGLVLNWALSPNKDIPQDIIKALGDAGRLICDSHYRESLSRRFAILSTLNKSIKDTVKNTQIDEHLFGTDLTDHIKSSKAINKTGLDMRPAPFRSAYRPPTTQFQRGALNSRGAPPRTPAATEPRSTPAPRRPPRNHRLDAPRGRRYSSYARHHQRSKRR